MTALPPVPQVVRVHLGWQVGNDSSAGSRLYWRYSGPAPTGAQCDGIASAFQTQIRDLWLGLLALSNNQTEIVVTDLSTNSGRSGEVPGAGQGTRAGEPLPANACLLMNHHIARRYRGGKPRTYLPFGVQHDLQSAQRWTSEALTEFGNQFNTLVSEINGKSFEATKLEEHVNVSYYAGTEWVPFGNEGHSKPIAKKRTTPFVDSIGSSSPNGIFGSQRRRLARAG